MNFIPENEKKDIPFILRFIASVCVIIFCSIVGAIIGRHLLPGWIDFLKSIRMDIELRRLLLEFQVGAGFLSALIAFMINRTLFCMYKYFRSIGQ